MSARPHDESAALFCAELPLADESKQWITDEAGVAEFLETLIAQRQYIDAVQVLAKMLPAREGVWWAAQCVNTTLSEATRPQELRALRAAEKWVDEMSEESRYEAFAAAQKARLGSPQNCVGMAAFVSGPSLAPQGSDPVPPAPDFPAKMVGGTVIASSISETPEAGDAKLLSFLEQGRALLASLQTES